MFSLTANYDIPANFKQNMENAKQNRMLLVECWQQYNTQLAKCNSPKSTQSDFEKLAKIKQKWHEQSNSVGYYNTTQINYKIK